MFCKLKQFWNWLNSPTKKEIEAHEKWKNDMCAILDRRVEILERAINIKN